MKSIGEEEEGKIADIREQLEADKIQPKESEAAHAQKDIEDILTQLKREMERALQSQLKRQEKEYGARMKKSEEEMSAREGQRKKMLGSLEAERRNYCKISNQKKER